jgi:hypothetical protein
MVAVKGQAWVPRAIMSHLAAGLVHPGNSLAAAWEHMDICDPMIKATFLSKLLSNAIKPTQDLLPIYWLALCPVVFLYCLFLSCVPLKAGVGKISYRIFGFIWASSPTMGNEI